VDALRITVDSQTYTLADFTRLPGRHRYLTFMPQWDLLDLLAEEAGRYPGFTLLRSTEATDVLREDGRVVGVRARGPSGELEVRAGLTVAADGRGSVVRERLGLTPVDYGAPMDVLWFRLPRAEADPVGLDMRVGAGGLLLLIDRGEYFQIAYVIGKGSYDAVGRGRAGPVPGPRRRPRPAPGRPGRPHRLVGRRQGAHRPGQPAASLVRARGAADRRRRARDVSHRRGRHQPRRPGRGGGGPAAAAGVAPGRR
jgi:2-polyprenyl-6-methoxyphenol hydroxylase-like FAD-dependent oxidoreductase